MLQPQSWKAEALYEPTVSEGDIQAPLRRLFTRYIWKADKLEKRGKSAAYYEHAAANVKRLIDGQ